jgi:putative oxidoreductase
MTATSLPSRPDTSAVPPRADLALLLLRVTVGVVFVAHGGQKIFAMGLENVVAGFGQAGIPLAGIVAPLVAFGELLGGLALVAGFLTRIAGPGLALIMVGAILAVHLPAGFFLPHGYEFALTLLAAAVALALTGPGRYSADAMIRARREG